MSDNKIQARELLAQEILKGFKGKITGECADYIVGKNPENHYFVGKLLPTNSGAQTSSRSSDVYIESIGTDFYISKDEIASAKLTVFPQGDFYYRAYPTLEQQREAMLQEANELFGDKLASFDELAEKYRNNPAEFKELRGRLVPVYKKVRINESDFPLTFSLSELLQDDMQYGSADEHHTQNGHLEQHLQALQDEVKRDEYCCLCEATEVITVEDLLSETAYGSPGEYSGFFGYCKNKPEINQHWRVYVDVRVKLVKDKYLVSVTLRNASQAYSNDETHKSDSKSDDKLTVETLFNSGLKIELDGAAFLPIDLDYFADDYKYDSPGYAVGNNCSVSFEKASNTITTNHMPTFVQKRLKTNDELAVTFESLINDPDAVLKEILEKMREQHKIWKQMLEEKKPSLSDVKSENMRKEIVEFERELRRFELGIDVINNHRMIRDSFVNMNRTFLNTAKGYNSWRLFQIVFIVSLVPDIAACDKKLLTEAEKEKTTLNEVSLLYFPTGGGKTEAFFGVLVFNLFFDRYRGKECGVTSILRYPLRLLSVQQVQRLANVLAQAELIRRADDSISGTEEFSLGYFVGDKNTPNHISNPEKYENSTQAENDKERIIDTCPFCGGKTVHLRFDRESYRLVHYCGNPECRSGGVLPIYMVDAEIYRYLPSAIISTVDKLAILGCNPNFRNILSGAGDRCPKHGFTSTRKCLAGKDCDVEVKDFDKVEMYDPAPTLFIQDELHLIRESLGTYASHYESFIDWFVKNVSPSKRPIKTIGATATISSYREQVSHLYSKDPIRFPCASPELDHHFYFDIDKNDTQRLIMGYAPYGKAIINAAVYSMKYMREVVFEYLKNPEKVLAIPGIGITSVDEAREILKDYWIFLEYNNVKRDGNNIAGVLETPVNVELRKSGVTPFKYRMMTGDESFQDVREVLADIETNEDVFNEKKHANLIVATSMISHGVDADRFNVMFFFGIPGSTAEYIQAYSRTGRRYTGIVIDIIRPSRETDQSYLKNFVDFHEFKDILVEPVPINRWATKAVDCTLPGIFTGLLLTKYDPEIQFTHGSLFYTNNIKKAIVNGDLKAAEICGELKAAYRCVAAGAEKEIGNQYSKKIDEFVEDILARITNKDWGEENIFKGFAAMGYRIMNSMRDTDIPLIIELK